MWQRPGGPWTVAGSFSSKGPYPPRLALPTSPLARLVLWESQSQEFMTQPSAVLSAQLGHISLPDPRCSLRLQRKKCAVASLGNASAVKRALNELVTERKMPHRFRVGFNPGCLIALSDSLTPSQPASSCPERGLTGWPHKQGTGKASYWSN